MKGLRAGVTPAFWKLYYNTPMQVRNVLNKLWQFISFIFVLYGFYLFFLFVWDTALRVNDRIALPLALLTTLLLMSLSGLLWLRKHRSSLPIKI